MRKINSLLNSFRRHNLCFSKGRKRMMLFDCVVLLLIICAFGYFMSAKGNSDFNSNRNVFKENFLASLMTFTLKIRHFLDRFFSQLGYSSKERLYIITPTYPRALQIPELTRVGNTLKNVENIIWIVAEDASKPTTQVLELLEFLGINYQYLLTPMPLKYYVRKRNTWPKGVENRNKALEWILKHVADTGDDSGVIYFADDDNTYDLRLFEEVRRTKRVSLVPVGHVSTNTVATPVLDRNGTFVKFFYGWHGNRTFPLDMAAFAVNLRFFIQLNSIKTIRMEYIYGYEEDTFVQQFKLEPREMEFLADNCTKIYVWHTKTQDPLFLAYDTLDSEVLKNTNLGDLLKYWCLYVNNQPCNFMD